MNRSDAQVRSLLPLSVPFYHILLALEDSDRHGYGIISEVAERTAGNVRLRTGTLYNAIRRMLELGLVEETVERPDPKLDDERRRYYQATELGRAVLRAEAKRLQQMVGLAQEKAVIS